MSPSQNEYNERLKEKLQVIASKRGADSPQAQELKHVAGEPAEAPKSVTEKKVKEK